MAIFGDTTATEAARDVFHATVVTLTDDLAVPCYPSKNSPFRMRTEGAFYGKIRFVKAWEKTITTS